MLVRDRNIGLAQVLDITGVGKTTLYEMIKEGEFPRAKKKGSRSLWSEIEVLTWQNRFHGREVGEIEVAQEVDDLVGGGE